MSGIIAKFGTPEPLKFMEKGCDTEFKVRMTGALYIDEYDESAYGTTEDERRSNLAKFAIKKLEEHILNWNQSDKILCVDGQNVLAVKLMDDLKEAGMMGSARIDNIRIPDEVYDIYQEKIMKPYYQAKEEKKRQEIEAAYEPHGPLRAFSYNLSSHGMMAGTSSYSNRKVVWNKDGSIIYSRYSTGSGRNIEMEYKITPDAAQKINDFVSDKRLAALAKMDIKTAQMFDNFTSSTIVMEFDDRSIGGDAYNCCTLQCGPSGFTFKSIEDEVVKLLDECEASGECIKSLFNEDQGTMTGFMGMKQMVGMIDMAGQPGHERPLEMMGLVAVDPDAGKAEATGEKWTCKCGQENTGKYCCGCGEPKPAGWICSCGHENTGKFCSNCGNPKSVASEDGTWECSVCKTTGNRGKFCASCGSLKPD